jgi:endonuclease/exonuclease/phosphatase family metal-dependent hydrolase
MRKLIIILLIIILFVTIVIVFYFWAKRETVHDKSYLVLYSDHLKEKSEGIISVMTYNVGYLSGMNNNLPVDQHDTIARLFFPYSLKVINWDKRYVPFPYWPLSAHFGKMLSGQSMMSSWKLNDPERVVLKEVDSNPFYYNAFYLDRLLISALVQHPELDFLIMNVHAEAFDQATREEQIQEIYQVFKEKRAHYPVILMGDFNSSPGSGEKAIHLFLDDPDVGCAAISDGKAAYPPTFSSENPSERIDYIFYTKDRFEEIESNVLTDFGTISDHLPVHARLKIKAVTLKDSGPPFLKTAKSYDVAFRVH